MQFTESAVFIIIFAGFVLCVSSFTVDYLVNITQVLTKILKIEGQMQIYDQLLFISLNFKDQNHLESIQSNFIKIASHTVFFYI